MRRRAHQSEFDQMSLQGTVIRKQKNSKSFYQLIQYDLSFYFLILTFRLFVLTCRIASAIPEAREHEYSDNNTFEQESAAKLSDAYGMDSSGTSTRTLVRTQRPAVVKSNLT